MIPAILAPQLTGMVAVRVSITPRALGVLRTLLVFDFGGCLLHAACYLAPILPACLLPTSCIPHTVSAHELCQAPPTV